MYKVYINHYKSGNSIVDTETLMFSVPSTGGFPVSKPVVKSSEDSADNFSFTMDLNSPYYDALLPLKTTIRVVYEGSTDYIIFLGRVLVTPTSTVYNTKNVTCEGVFSYFNDTYYEGVQEKHRTNISLSTFYDRIINNHNSNTPAKSITKGTVGVTLPSETDKYEPTSWTQTLSLLNSMTSNYGGHMKIRYSGTTPYLDWYKYYWRDLGNGSRPAVTIGKNILDISSDQNVDDIFTRVIPIGDTDKDGMPIYIDGYQYTDTGGTSHTHSGKAFPVSLVRSLYTDQELTDEFHDYKDYRDAESNFGVIYKTMQFSDADTKAKLWNYTKKWVKESFYGLTTSFSVKAIDMHITNSNAPQILLGDCVDVTYLITRNGAPTWETKKLVCKSVTYDLFNPENNTYTFGIPSDLLEHTKSSKKKTTTTKNTVSTATAANRPTTSHREDGELTWRKIARLIGELNSDPDYEGTAAYTSFVSNGELSGTVTCYDPEEVPSDPLSHRDKWFTAQIVGKITIPGKSTKWVAVSSEYGIFAYKDVAEVNPVTHWYSRKKGYQYEGSDAGLSSFEKIAKMIENDNDSTYGGSTNAASFRSNGELSGSVRCYNPDDYSGAGTVPSQYIFTANIVGKFGSSGSIKYVAVSSEYGIFAYTHSAYPDKVKHWYTKAKGITYNNISNLVHDKNGNAFSTSDGSPDSKKTVWLKTQELTGHGSQGEVLIGINTDSGTDNWRVKLNIPIQYTDEDGDTQVADGFVSASDFNISSIPSFKTKMIVADVIIAGKVNATDIAADIAYIRKINSQSVSASTYVSAYQINGTNGVFSNNVDVGGKLRIEDTDEQYRDVGKCFDSALFSEDNGVITLTLGRVNGSTSATPNFNMAATNFYQNAVAAARTGGWQDCYSDINLNYTTDQTISSGNSITIYPACKQTPSGQHASITTKGITITATGGGGANGNHSIGFATNGTNPISDRIICESSCQYLGEDGLWHDNIDTYDGGYAHATRTLILSVDNGIAYVTYGDRVLAQKSTGGGGGGYTQVTDGTGSYRFVAYYKSSSGSYYPLGGGSAHQWFYK